MPFAEKVTTVVYGLILVTVNGYVIDMYLSGSQQSVQLFILSKKYAEIQHPRPSSPGRDREVLLATIH